MNNTGSSDRVRNFRGDNKGIATAQIYHFGLFKKPWDHGSQGNIKAHNWAESYVTTHRIMLNAYGNFVLAPKHPWKMKFTYCRLAVFTTAVRAKIVYGKVGTHPQLLLADTDYKNGVLPGLLMPHHVVDILCLITRFLVTEVLYLPDTFTPTTQICQSKNTNNLIQGDLLDD